MKQLIATLMSALYFVLTISANLFPSEARSYSSAVSAFTNQHIEKKSRDCKKCDFYNSCKVSVKSEQSVKASPSIEPLVCSSLSLPQYSEMVTAPLGSASIVKIYKGIPIYIFARSILI